MALAGMPGARRGRVLDQDASTAPLDGPSALGAVAEPAGQDDADDRGGQCCDGDAVQQPVAAALTRRRGAQGKLVISGHRGGLAARGSR
jgi:hypothetical protein